MKRQLTLHRGLMPSFINLDVQGYLAKQHVHVYIHHIHMNKDVTFTTKTYSCTCRDYLHQHSLPDLKTSLACLALYSMMMLPPSNLMAFITVISMMCFLGFSLAQQLKK